MTEGDFLLPYLLCTLAWSGQALAGYPVEAVEAEDIVYSIKSPDNGAGPLWDFGSTNLMRLGEQVFASCLENLPRVATLEQQAMKAVAARFGGVVAGPH